MKLTESDVAQLRAAFSSARIAGVESVFITENLVRGITLNTRSAIITPVKLSIDSAVKIGVGRMAELEKRLNIFGTEATAELKLNDKNEVTVLDIRSGKSKIEFRCTSERMIKYPKTLEDTELCKLKITKDEASQISRAIKSLSAQSITLAIGRDSGVSFECSSDTNEAFSVEIEAKAIFENPAAAAVHIYDGDRFSTVLDAAARDADAVVTLGELFGSLTFDVKGHTLILMPIADHEGDDDE